MITKKNYQAIANTIKRGDRMKTNLDLEFEKFKTTYKGKNIEKDWQTYQKENNLYDISNEVEE